MARGNAKLVAELEYSQDGVVIKLYVSMVVEEVGNVSSVQGMEVIMKLNIDSSNLLLSFSLWLESVTKDNI